MIAHEVSQLERWFARAQIDYAQYYMALFAAFNAWYTEYTGAVYDRLALNRLRGGVPLWDAYARGERLSALDGPMRFATELTQREPLPVASPHWDGVVRNRHDWPSLIEYWYRVRCLVMHGAEINPQYIYVAYETLNILMGEIVSENSY